MKKITSLLMLSLAFAGTAWAQTSSTPAGNKLVKTSWTIKASTSSNTEGAGNGIAKAAIDGDLNTHWHSSYGSGEGFNQGGNCPHYFVIDMQTNVEVTGFSYTPRKVNQGVGNGTCKSYEFYVSDKPFSNVKTPANNQNEANAYKTGLATADASGNMTEDAKEKVVALNTAKTGRYVLFVITGATGGFGSCGEFDVYSTTVVKNAEVTYNYKIGNRVYTTKKSNQIVGTTALAPEAVDYITINSSDADKVTVSENGQNVVNVVCSEKLPFEVTTDQTNPNYYFIKMHSNQYHIVQYTANDTQMAEGPGKDKKLDLLSTTGCAWYFMGNLIDGFKIYNKDAGKDVTLNATADAPKVGTAVNGNDTWYLVRSTSNQTCFTHDKNTQQKKYMNWQSTVKYWGSNDAGSSCQFIKPVDIVKAYDIYYPKNAVNGYTDASIDAYNTAIAEALKDPFSLKSLPTLTANNMTIEAGAYYRLQNVQRGTALSTNGTKAVPGTVGKSNVNDIWQFVAGTGTNVYKVYSPNHKNYLPAPGNLVSGINAGVEYTLVDLTEGQFNLKVGGNNLVDYGNGSLGSWGSNPKGSDGAWYIVKATELEVPLTNVAGANYATAYLPFEVSAVAGATAHIGTVTNGVLKATSVTSVPAETGIILKDATSTKATLTIGKATQTEKGQLSGTLLGQDWAGELVLGNSNGQLGFYSMTAGKKIGANKAFIPAAQAAQGLVLSFDGEATGIESVMGTANTNAPIFDLSGRRVVKTVKGGLYIQNGKKFIVR